MKTSALLSEISKNLNKQEIEELAWQAARSEVSIDSLISLSFNHDKKIAFRAAWILEKAQGNYPGGFYPYLGKFIQVFPLQENDSCRRHYTNILKHYVMRFHLQEFPDEVIEKLAETVFEWLIEAKTPAAIKANCLDILFDFSKRFDWIAEELTAQIHFLLKDGGPAIQSRGKKILGKLG